MPIPMEQQCWNLLFNLSMSVGALYGWKQGKENRTWDDDLLSSVGNLLVDMGDCLLAERCLDSGLAVADALNVLADNPDISDKEKAQEQLQGLGQSLVQLVGCLNEAYATTAGIIEEQTFPPEGWPGDGFWVQEIRPLRIGVR